MHRAKYVIPVLFALAALLGITGWWLYRAAQPIELALYFHPFVGPEPLVLNESRHPNPGGEGRFKVRDFQFFLSNIRLTGGTGVYTEPDSYHLVRFDGAEPAFSIVLHKRGDLNPNGRMAWNWEVGYKFVLFEGTLVRGNASVPLVYHVGFEENYRLIATELHREPLDSRPARLNFRVDILRPMVTPMWPDAAGQPDGAR